MLAEAEIVFAHLDNSRANQIFGPKNFVFTQQLLGVLDLAKAQQRAKQADSAGGRPGRVERTAPRCVDQFPDPAIATEESSIRNAGSVGMDSQGSLRKI